MATGYFPTQGTRLPTEHCQPGRHSAEHQLKRAEADDRNLDRPLDGEGDGSPITQLGAEGERRQAHQAAVLDGSTTITNSQPAGSGQDLSPSGASRLREARKVPVANCHHPDHPSRCQQ